MRPLKSDRLCVPKSTGNAQTGAQLLQKWSFFKGLAMPEYEVGILRHGNPEFHKKT